MKFSFDKVYVLNMTNLLVSIGLLGFGIAIIVYGLKIPPSKCKHDDRRNCLTAFNGNVDIYDTVEYLRVLSIITGFLLLIPIILNSIQLALTYVPGKNPITQFVNRIVNTSTDANTGV